MDKLHHVSINHNFTSSKKVRKVMKDGVEVLLYFNQLRDEINPIEAQSILHESKDDFSNNLPSHPPY